MRVFVKIALLLFSSFLLICNYYYDLSDYVGAIYIYCILSYIITLMLDVCFFKKLNPYLIFQIPFGLFILGRLFGWAIDSDLDPRNIVYFKSIYLTAYQVIYYYIISIIFFISCSIGVEFSKKKIIIGKSYSSPKIDENVLKLFIICVLAIFIPLIFFELLKLINVVMSNGYAAMYIYKKESVGNSFSMALNIISISLGLASMYKMNKYQNIIMIVLLFISLSMLFLGARGPIMTYFLLYLWVYKRNENIVKMFFYSILALIVIQVLNSFVREVASSNNLLAKFIYDQGTTFIILPFTEYIHSWPTIGLLQNFIPGISRILSVFIEYNPVEANLSNYMAYVLNPELQSLGNGLGWTIIADLFIYSNGITIIFIIFAFIVGFFLGKLSYIDESYYSLKIGLVTAVMLQLSFLYRSGLFALVPLIAYFLVIYLFLAFVSRMLSKSQSV